jgi:hypothetical protein
MLGWEAIPRVVISFLWLQSFAGGGRHDSKKGIKDNTPKSSALSSEVQNTPGVLVLYSKQSTKADFFTDKKGNII